MHKSFGTKTDNYLNADLTVWSFKSLIRVWVPNFLSIFQLLRKINLEHSHAILPVVESGLDDILDSHGTFPNNLVDLFVIIHTKENWGYKLKR